MRPGPSYHRPPTAVRVRQVIECEALRGRGVEGDPIRQVIQFWSLAGELLAEDDPDAPGRGVHAVTSTVTPDEAAVTTDRENANHE